MHFLLHALWVDGHLIWSSPTAIKRWVMTRYEPNGPDDFDGLRCDLDESKNPKPTCEGQYEEPQPESGTKSFVAKLSAVSIAVGLGLAGVHGLATGDFQPLNTVWAITAVPVGAALAVLTKRCG